MPFRKSKTSREREFTKAQSSFPRDARCERTRERERERASLEKSPLALFYIYSCDRARCCFQRESVCKRTRERRFRKFVIVSLSPRVKRKQFASSKRLSPSLFNSLFLSRFPRERTRKKLTLSLSLSHFRLLFSAFDRRVSERRDI